MLIPLLFLNYLTLKEGKITSVVDAELIKTFNNILNNFKILLIHGLVKNVNNVFWILTSLLRRINWTPNSGTSENIGNKLFWFG